MLGTSLPRIPMAQLPTPVAHLRRLSSALGGPELWVKRDDQTGLAFGGNKARKLELLVAEAEAQDARTLITRGAVQSNHCRQTAAAAAARGLHSILVLSGGPPATPNGNLLLDRLLGAEIVWAHEQNPQAMLEATFARAEAEGRRPYLVPYGGSSPLGASAYALALQECLAQVLPDWIVLASSSGGTQAGMVAGARLLGFEGRILGISVDQPAAALRSEVARLATEVCALLGQAAPVDPGSVLVEDRFAAPGYAVLTSLEREAISVFSRQEGILLDPVYTGRAAGALLTLAKEGRFASGQRVLFWHTGGTPALFAYAAELASA